MVAVNKSRTNVTGKQKYVNVTLESDEFAIFAC
jgi:hypothetical protein